MIACPSSFGVAVPFEDADLELAVCDHLGIEPPVTEKSLSSLRGLFLNGIHLTSFVGLERATNLVTLRINNCTIHDVKGLANLATLQELAVRNCGLSNVAGIGDMVNLKYLSLAHNKIRDVSELSALTNLRHLDLSDNQLSEFTSLTSMVSLESLDMRGNPVPQAALEQQISGLRHENSRLTTIRSGKAAFTGSAASALLANKTKIARIAVCGKFEAIPNVVFPQLPLVTQDTQNAIDSFAAPKVSDPEVLADIAVLFLRYAHEIDQNYPPGGPMDPKYPFLGAFVRSLQPDLPGDEVIERNLANWICEHREAFGPSALLDIEISKFRALVEELRKRYGSISHS